MTALRVSIASVCLLAMLGVSSNLIDAHDQGWRWDYGLAIPVVENRTSSWGYAVSSAAINYNNATDMHVDGCASFGYCGNVVHIQGNYGANGQTAWAAPYSQGTPCADFIDPTGYCNKTNHKVDFGYSYWNDFYYYPYGNHVARHEMGHIFGLAHPSCGTSSVMVLAGCNSFYSSLSPHDTSDLNSFY